MAKFIIRRLLLMLLTMFLVSVAVFLITEAAPGNVARNVLGIHITPAQEASFLNQVGLDEPLYERYVNWLLGTDWRASRLVGMPVKRVMTADGFVEWWAIGSGAGDDGSLVRWSLEGGDLIARQRQPDGSVEEVVDNEQWQVKAPAEELERLEAYREKLVSSTQLTDSDRQAVLTELDRILEALRQDYSEPDALEQALAAPEAALQELVDPDAAAKKEALRGAVENVGRDRLVQAVGVYQTLTSPEAGDLGTSELQTLMRRLGPAAAAIEDDYPAAAGQLRGAADMLREGDVAGARETLAAAMPTLNEATGSLGVFVHAVNAEDYQRAAAVLRELVDPSAVSLGVEQAAYLQPHFERIGNNLEDAAPELGEALLAAAGSLEEGATESARVALDQAAARLADLGQTLALNDAATIARVARTFWGIDTENHAVRWEKGAGETAWVFIVGTGWKAFSGGPTEYIPLQKGLLRGDPGLSLRTGRPVASLLFTRLRNSLVLAGIAFAIVMPLALVLGLIAGINEGKVLDRFLSIGGMMFSVTPEFATGIFLILIFAFWLDLVPGATVFGEQAPWSRPDMLILPVATLTLIELGYVLRITRASMVEVMKAPYIRTAFLKGLPYWTVVSKHAVRNALMAPITIIMLHVNWLLGGIVVVEVIFGYPGLGSYLLESALFKDFNAIEGGAMILVTVAVGTQLIADIAYTFLNPRIRYS